MLLLDLALGMGVECNDDSTGLQATVTGASISGLGHLVLAVSQSDQDKTWSMARARRGLPTAGSGASEAT